MFLPVKSEFYFFDIYKFDIIRKCKNWRKQIMSQYKGGVIHWTAGSYVANNIDKKSYHYLYEYNSKNKTSNVIEGIYKPSDNLNCNDGKYAPHVGGMNTGRIGVALCAMAGFKNKTNVGLYPIVKVQFEKMCSHIATLCKLYNLKPNNWETHYEIGKKIQNGIIKKTSLNALNIGKIDIICLPFEPNISQNQIGDYIRNKINWYYLKVC